MKTYNQRELNILIKDIDNLNIKRIQNWIYRGVFSPKIEKKSGLGEHRIFSLENIYQIFIIEEIASIGISINIIKNIMLLFNNNSITNNKEKMIVIGKPIESRCSENEFQYYLMTKKDYIHFLKNNDDFLVTSINIEKIVKLVNTITEN